MKPGFAICLVVLISLAAFVRAETHRVAELYHQLVFAANSEWTANDGGSSNNNFWNISYPQFVRALVRNGHPQPTPVQYHYFISRAIRRPETMIQTKQEMAMFLAQVIHESGGLQYKSEWGCPAESKCRDYSYPTWDPRKCGSSLSEPCHQEPYAPNTLYYGRGYIQLSWTVNYEAASWALYGDDRLWKIPDMVVLDLVSWDTAYWYWESFVSPAPGVRNGLFGASTKAINGALECGPGGNIAAAKSRFKIYQTVFEALELPGVPLEAGCYPLPQKSMFQQKRSMFAYH